MTLRTFAAVTTCHEGGYNTYGRGMVDSFDRHWPQDVTLDGKPAAITTVEGRPGVLLEPGSHVARGRPDREVGDPIGPLGRHR